MAHNKFRLTFSCIWLCCPNKGTKELSPVEKVYKKSLYTKGHIEKNTTTFKKILYSRRNLRLLKVTVTESP